jgi:hypothetical protein
VKCKTAQKNEVARENIIKARKSKQNEKTKVKKRYHKKQSVENFAKKFKYD